MNYSHFVFGLQTRNNNFERDGGIEERSETPGESVQCRHGVRQHIRFGVEQEVQSVRHLQGAVDLRSAHIGQSAGRPENTENVFAQIHKAEQFLHRGIQQPRQKVGSLFDLQGTQNERRV